MSSARRFGAAGAMLLAMVLTGCTQWRASADSPGVVIPAEAPDAIRVTTQGGVTTTIPAPLLRNDSIVSSRPSGPRVALSEVSRFEVREFSLSRSLGLAAAGVAGAAAWTVVLAGSGSDLGNPAPDPKLSPTLMQGWAWIGRLLTGG